MKYKVLISAPYLQPVIEKFRPEFEKRSIELVIPTVNERLEEEELLEYIDDLDGTISGDDKFTERVLSAAKKLKVISKWGTGIDSFDLEACKKYNIRVCNTPNAFTIPVSDSVLSYILSFARRTPWMNEAMHQGHWEKIPGRSLQECTLGVIGVGNIGRAVIQKAKAFGMKLLGNDIVSISQQYIEEVNLQMVSFEELLRQSDFVSVNCDLNETSYHLINHRALTLMKPEAVLINTARGPVVDEKALINGLMSSEIAGVALDVFEHEPLPSDSPLLSMQNVLMAPHNSNSSPAAWEKVHTNTINNLFDGLGIDHKL